MAHYSSPPYPSVSLLLSDYIGLFSSSGKCFLLLSRQILFFVYDETKMYMVWSLSFFFSRLESMAAPPARARADYDYLIKLLLIGDSGTSYLSFLHVFVSRDPRTWSWTDSSPTISIYLVWWWCFGVLFIWWNWS